MNWLRLLTATLALAFVSTALAGGKKGGNSGISFHIETGAGEHPRMIFEKFVNGENRTFRRVPEFTAKDVAAFNPFPSQDGEGYGIVLQLKNGPKNRMSAVTAANIGRWMLATVNGRVVDAVVIDQQVNDGHWVIWKGISLAEIQGFDKHVPRIGEKKPRG